MPSRLRVGILQRLCVRHAAFLKPFGRKELADDGGSVLMLGVDGVVQAAHVGGGKFSRKIGECAAELRKPRESGLTDDGGSVVGRKIVEVVDKRNEAERVNEAVGGVAGDNVHLMVEEGAVNEPEIHDVGRRREAERVAITPAAEAVGALEEFIADADAPFRSEGSDVGYFLQMKALGVFGADDHGERIFEAERLGDFELETLGVKLFDAAVDRVGIALGGFVEDGGEGRAGVFDVEVEVSREKSFVDEERAAEIGFADDGNAGAGFDVLGEQLGENDLFGEKLGTDRDFPLGRAAGDEKWRDEKEESETAHVRRSFSWEKEEFNTQFTEIRAQRMQRKCKSTNQRNEMELIAC
jgi:hypothetical protein